MAKVPVLLLDDDIKWLKIFPNRLPQSKYYLETATRFEEALEKIEQFRYPVVVSDLRLIGRKYGGFELLDKVKNVSEYTKVIIITAHGGSATDIANKAIDKGAYNYFSKPVEENDLDVCICSAIAEWHLKVESFYSFGESIDPRDIELLKLIVPSINSSGKQLQAVTSSNYDRKSLIDEIDASFDDDEIRELCYILYLDPENVTGNNKRAKVISLLRYFERRHNVDQFLAECIKIRPHLQSVLSNI